MLTDFVRYMRVVAFIPLVIVECMKMEFPVAVSCAGKVLQVFAAKAPRSPPARI